MRSAATPQRRRQSQERVKRLSWILGVTLLTILFAVIIIVGDYGLYQVHLLNKEKRQINQNISGLMSRQDSLKEEIALLESDIAYIEKLAREKYRMAHPGEKVFRVIERE